MIVFTVLVGAYLVLEGIYLYRAYDVQASLLNTAKHRFSLEGRFIMLMFSLVTVMLVAFPFANRTLAFVSHNGMVNLYMQVTSYFFEGYEKEENFDVYGESEMSERVDRKSVGSDDIPDQPQRSLIEE